MSPKKPFFARQPGKIVYTAAIIASTFIRIPLLLITYIVPHLRPRKDWTYYQSLSNELTRIVFDTLSVVEFSTTRSLNPDADGDRFVLIQPRENTPYPTSHPNDTIKPGPVGAIWMPQAPSAGDRGNNDEPVFLHFHGGGFVLLSPRMPNIRWGPQVYIDDLAPKGGRVLLVNYRLASNEGGVFPAALQDAVTAYQYLLQDCGVAPERVFFSGDSAGANLVLALLRFIAEGNAEANSSGVLPTPGGAMLWSPWVDMAKTPEEFKGWGTDYLTASTMRWGVREYIPEGRSPEEKWFSPRRHPFKVGTKIFMGGGGAEVLCGDIVETAETFEREGNEVMLDIVDAAMHDTFAGGKDLGFEKEARESVKKAGKFLGILPNE